jgi:type VII secretion-associated serine protease mycosin
MATLVVLSGLTLPSRAQTAPACNLPATSKVTAAPWSAARLGLSRVWPLTEGAGVVVGVVDSGVDDHHPMLAGRVSSGVDVVPNGGPATADCVGHGTFVAGLIAAGHEPGIGFAGVAPQARIVPIRQTTDGRDGTVDTLADGIRAAVDLGARVVNVSITYNRSSPRLADAVAYAQVHDVVVVAAAGNTNGSAASSDVVNYPAGYPGVLSVGAVDEKDAVTQFSKTATPVSVVAPGADLLGPGAGGTGLVTGQDGTSFAAAFVTGVVALVRAYRPGLRADQVVHRIEATADRPPGTAVGYGWGVVDPYQALSEELPEEYGVAPVSPSASEVSLAAVPTHEQSGALAVVITVALLALAALIATAALVLRRRRNADASV